MVKIIERITYRDDDTLENTERKIEIPGRVVGSQMTAGVLYIMGWHLVMIDREHLTSVQIDGENESDLLELKRLLEKVDGDCFGAGTGAGTVQRELGGGI